MRNLTRLILLYALLSASASLISCKQEKPVESTASSPPAAVAKPEASTEAKQENEKPLNFEATPDHFVKTAPPVATFNITNPKTAQEHFNFAVHKHGKNEFDAAIEHYKKALELRPGWAIAHFRLGRAYQQKGNLDAAIEQWHQATRAEPRYYDAYANLAAAYHQKGDLRKAAESYEHLLEYPQGRGAVHYRLGFWYQELGDKAKARQHLQSYIDLALQSKSEPGTERYQRAVRALEKLTSSS